MTRTRQETIDRVLPSSQALVKDGESSGGVSGQSVLWRRILPFCVFIFAAVWLSRAYVAEDAYITFRSVEQVFAGHGPRWNPHERVQVFTHPLWFMMLCCGRMASSDLYLVATVLCLLLSCLAIVRVASMCAGQWRHLRIALLFLILLLSKAFMDYSSGGLENALTCFLLSALLVHLQQLSRLSEANHDLSRFGLPLALLCSCFVLTRHDNLTLIAPAACYCAWLIWRGSRDKMRVVWGCLLGFLPFMAWTLFSLLYYGFPFPNTAYAKLFSDRSLSSRVLDAGVYFVDSLRNDPISLALMLACLMVALRAGSAVARAMAGGVLLHTVYVIWVGGDWMSGRMFADSVFVSAAVVALWARPDVRFFICAFVLRVLPSFVLDPNPPIGSFYGVPDTGVVRSFRGIEDVRAGMVHRHGTSLLEYMKLDRVGQFPVRGFGVLGAHFRRSPERVFVYPAMGIPPYLAGLDKIFVDPMGLTDPLLAHIKGTKHPGFLSGHIERKIPQGYIQSLISQTNTIEQAHERRLYEEIRMITQGPILSRERLKAIFRANVSGLGGAG